MSTTEFTQQLASLNPELRSFTRKFTSDRDESLDLVQDTLVKALTYKDKFTKDTNLKGWLFTIMRNTYINKYRKYQREKTNTDNSKNLYYLNVEDTHTFNKPETNFEYHDIWNKINELPEDLLTPFKLYTSGYKYEEIATHIGIPLGTVKNRIFHARKEIQKKIGRY